MYKAFAFNMHCSGVSPYCVCNQLLKCSCVVLVERGRLCQNMKFKKCFLITGSKIGKTTFIIVENTIIITGRYTMSVAMFHHKKTRLIFIYRKKAYIC